MGRPWERVLRWSTVVFGLLLTSFSIAWLMVWPPHNVYDPISYCWFRKVYNATLFGSDTAWRCVRCAHQSCINGWSSQHWIYPETLEACTNELGWAAAG